MLLRDSSGSMNIQCRRYFFALANLGITRLTLVRPLAGISVQSLATKKEYPRPILGSDTLDVFLDEMMSNKTSKWKSKSQKPKGCYKTNVSSRPQRENDNYIKTEMSKNTLTNVQSVENEIFLAAKNGNHQFVFQSLNSFNFCTHEVLHKLASIFLKSDSLKEILILEEIANSKLNTTKPQFYEYHIKCLKQRGDLTTALNLCDELYELYPDIRREVRGYLSHILIDIVENNSEASLVQAKELVEHLSVKYKDFRPISSLWHACFLSEWFSDQQVASQLLIHVINQNSVSTIERRMLAATFTALAQHRPELVYGLLQDLLGCKLSNHITPILRALFDYKCSQGDLKGCASILQTSLQFNITLTSQQHIRFLDLLCRKRKSRWLGKSQGDEPPVKPKLPPPFQLKF